MIDNEIKNFLAVGEKMADVKLKNTASIVGNYDSVHITLVSEAVITEMIA